jgi:hypothetical protein
MAGSVLREDVNLFDGNGIHCRFLDVMVPGEGVKKLERPFISYHLTCLEVSSLCGETT